MKRYYLIVAFLVLSVFGLYAQRISEEGRLHWEKADYLYNTAQSSDDYLDVIREYKAVLRSDPNFANAYYNIGKLYIRIEEFTLASVFLNRYKELVPDEAEQIDEMLYLEKIRLYRNTGIANLIGEWTDDQDNPTMTISIKIKERKMFFVFWMSGMPEPVTISDVYPELDDGCISLSSSGQSSFRDGWIWKVDGDSKNGKRVFTTHTPYDYYLLQEYYWCDFFEYYSASISFIDDTSVFFNNGFQNKDGHLNGKLLIGLPQYYQLKPSTRTRGTGRSSYSEYYWEPLIEIDWKYSFVLERRNDPPISSLL